MIIPPRSKNETELQQLRKLLHAEDDRYSALCSSIPSGKPVNSAACKQIRSNIESLELKMLVCPPTQEDVEDEKRYKRQVLKETIEYHEENNCLYVQHNHPMFDNCDANLVIMNRFQRKVDDLDSLPNETPLMYVTRKFDQQKDFFRIYCSNKRLEDLQQSSACQESIELLIKYQNSKEKKMKEYSYTATSPIEVTETDSPKTTDDTDSPEDVENICESCEVIKTGEQYFSTHPSYEFLENLLNFFDVTDFSSVYRDIAGKVLDLLASRNEELVTIYNKLLPTNTPFIFDIQLKNFTILPEYFLGVNILYKVIAVTWFYRKYYALVVQKTLCEIFGVSMLMMCFLYYNDLLKGLDSSFYKAIINDDLSKFAKFTLSFFSAIYFLNLANSFEEQKMTSPEYTILLGFSILGLLVLCSGNDLLTVYLSLELISLSSYVLAAFKKSQHSSESGLKYFIIGSISSSFFLLGSSLLYLETNSIYLVDYSDLLFYTHLAQPETLNTHLIDIALFCIFFSLFIKLACAPFHLWSLDVYEESPTSSSIYFATITKLSFFIVLIRITFYVFFQLCFVWATLFTMIGMLSAFIGALGGLRQKKIKTLLAYSSISNMGYALIALGGFSDAAVWATLVHLVIYQFSGLCIWSLLVVAQLKTTKEKYSKELGDLSLLRKANLSITLAFIITIFSLAGIPPLLGFIPKVFIISDVLRTNFIAAAAFLALCSVIAAFYYIRILKVLCFENLLVGKLYFPVFNLYSILLSFLAHSLLYAFSDIGFLTVIIISGGATLALNWTKAIREVLDLVQFELIRIFNIIRLEELLEYLDFKPQGLIEEMSIIILITVQILTVVDNWIRNSIEMKRDLAILGVLSGCGWKEPSNPFWLTEAIIETEVAVMVSEHFLVIGIVKRLLGMSH